MPIYEYVCTKCNFEFDLRLPFSESDKAVTCLKCKAPTQKLHSSFGCKTGGNIQAAEKPFRKNAIKESSSSSVMITPPPNQTKLLSQPAKKITRARPKKK